MLSEAQRFWDAISGKVKQAAQEVAKNTFRCERYEVTTAPNGLKIGVTLPMGTREIFLPYSREVSGATVGSQVLVVWWGSMSNAKVYYYANGYEGSGASSILDAWPVGAIYESTESTSPAQLFGGSWLALDDGRVLVGANSTYTAGSTGGDANHTHTTQSHTLTTSEIPAHSHGTGNETHTTFVAAKYGTDYAITRTGFTTGSTQYAYTNTTASDGNLTRVSTTGDTGDGGAHSHGDTGSSSNMQPYLAVYRWKRIA